MEGYCLKVGQGEVVEHIPSEVPSPTSAASKNLQPRRLHPRQTVERRLRQQRIGHTITSNSFRSKLLVVAVRRNQPLNMASEDTEFSSDTPQGSTSPQPPPTGSSKRFRPKSTPSTTGPGPSPAPPHTADSDHDCDIGPPMPPPATFLATSRLASKKIRREETQRQAILRHHSLYLDALPSAARYHQSFMHRAPINFVSVTPTTQFVITSSVNGHVKFWKKQEVGIEFVKHYRAHLGVITAISTSTDGAMFATTGNDRSVKVFDVFNFDLINMIKLDYVPRTVCWIHRKGRSETVLAVVPEDSSVIYLYEGRGDGTPFVKIDSVHRKPVHLMAFNETANCIVSADEGGMVEYWRPEEPWEKPSSSSVPGIWDFKTATDLFDFKKTKSVPTSISFSPDFSRFVARSLPDRHLRVFDFATGKIMLRIDESLTANQEALTAGTAGVRLDEMELGRRLALEKQLDRESQEGGAVNASQGLKTENAVFDETGHFLVYPTMLGIKGESQRHSSCTGDKCALKKRATIYPTQSTTRTQEKSRASWATMSLSVFSTSLCFREWAVWKRRRHDRWL